MRTKRRSGIALEQKVMAWAKRKFDAEVDTRYQVNGLSVKRPYEVDVWVRIPGGFLKRTKDLWIECKDRRESIKRRDISDLINKAKDVYQAANVGREDSYFDQLMFVSTSSYDSDALALADQEGVACIIYDGTRFRLQNEWDWEEHKWLRDVKAIA